LYTLFNTYFIPYFNHRQYYIAIMSLYSPIETWTSALVEHRVLSDLNNSDL